MLMNQLTLALKDLVLTTPRMYDYTFYLKALTRI